MSSPPTPYLTLVRPEPGAVYRPADLMRWTAFERFIEGAECEQAELLREAYLEACARPGHWVTTMPILGLDQWFRALTLRSWQPHEPQMAVWCRGVQVRLAFAELAVPARQHRPSWFSMLRGFRVSWYDRPAPVRQPVRTTVPVKVPEETEIRWAV